MTQPQRPVHRTPSNPPPAQDADRGTADTGRIADRPSLERARKGKDPALLAVLWFLLPLALLVGLAMVGAP